MKTLPPNKHFHHLRCRPPVALLLVLMLAACGGDNGTGNSLAALDEGSGTARIVSTMRSTLSSATETPAKAEVPSEELSKVSRRVPAADRPASRLDAFRFMTNATFGPTTADEEVLKVHGYSGWIERQFNQPQTSHRAHWEAADAVIKASIPTSSADQRHVIESFWKQALTGRDQLRQRVVFALSQLFVISMVDTTVGNETRAVAAWMDMLGSNAFGNYRTLLEAVSLHPQMGRYLSHLQNQKANAATGRVPDENYAREVMQLFSTGLVQLNNDGTPKLVNGQPVETYGPADVSGLARVFTGFSWACPGAPTNEVCFTHGSTGGSNSQSDPDRQFKPMVGYPAFHSTEAKSFLGTTIPAQATANPDASLKAALDTIFNHPNVGPFFGKQLIQRLVTSNPSPAYVAAVANAFNNNGLGVRGDMKAVIRAILLHPEARAMNNGTGKVREPVLRLSAYLRAFPHTSDTGAWQVGNTDSPSQELGQTALRSPSVFNFFRPGYVDPGSQSARVGLVTPEMQLVSETSVSGWANYMRDNFRFGVGTFNNTVNGVTYNRRDLQRDWSLELELAADPAKLALRVVDKLLYGQAAPELKQEIATVVSSITIPATGTAAIAEAKQNRLGTALMLTLVSPEFLVQK